MNNLEQRLAALSPEQRALLAQRLKERGEAKTETTQGPPPIAPADRSGPLPLSFAQQRLWFLDQFDPNSSRYTIVVAYGLRGQLDQAAFVAALEAIVRRHEALRTTIETIDGLPVQKIADSMPLPFAIHDLSGLAPDAAETAAAEISERVRHEPFDLAAGPLFRVAVCEFGPERSQVIMAFHHIVFDEWSLGVLLRELSALYSARVRRAEPELPPLAIQYADVADWQRKWLQGEVLEQQLAYWRTQLAGPPPALNLPTDRPHPPIQTFNSARVRRRLPASLAKGVNQLAQREGMTPYMVLLATYQLVLSRYSGQREFLVGSPIANRTRPELEPLIGCFINTLVLRADLRGQPSGRDLLRRVRETALGAFSHQDLPFEALVDDLNPERDLSRTALFQVLFDFHNTGESQLRLGDLAAEPLPLGEADARFDLSLVMGAEGDGLTAVALYNRDLFDAATIERFLGHYQTLLERLLAAPDAPVFALPLLTAPEWDALVRARNATAAPFALDRPLHAWFEDQVARTPTAIAARSADATLSYADLNAQANRLAHHLRSLAVAPEVRVGICLERSPAMLVGLLAILKAGAAFVPLDPAFPADRMAYILDDAGVDLVLTQDSLAARLPERPQTVLCLDRDAQRWADQPPANPVSGVTGANLAYLIYTSGSTGRPKGVLIPHSGIANYLLWGIEAYGAASGIGAPVHASIAADAIFPSLFMPLYVGTAVTFFPGDGALTDLGTALQHDGPWSLIKITPSQLEVLTHELPPQPRGAADWVRTLVIGAEALRGEVLTYWQTHAPATVLLNEYGPTETVVGCSIYQVPVGRRIAGAVPIGLPIANLTFYVLDPAMQPVPVGVPGELYIGGVGVAWGYHNRQTLTAEKFVPDPFGAAPGSRLYRTGDVVRWLADAAGNIEFLGRDDDQVKIRGYRVELGEVEAVLDHHDQVWEVVVLARELAGVKRLVAYVVPEPGAALSASGLREYLLARVPEYMVPSVFMFLEALPLAPHGKIDRQALPLPDSERPAEAGAAVAPRTPVETVLTTIWQEVLGLATIGIYDNFFELGGDSILSIQIIARANAAGWRLTPRQMFLHQTIAEIAEVAEPAAGLAVDQGLVIGDVPLTPVQWRFFEQELADRNQYNQAIFLEAREQLDAGRIEQAVGQLLRHHDAFRLRFDPAGDGWRQRSAEPEESAPFARVDLAGVAAGEQDAAVAAAAAAMQRQLDLARGPLLKIALFERGAAPQLVLLIAHHIVIDGISWRIVLEDLATLYAGQALPAKTTSYQSWAQRLTDYAASPELAAELPHWAAQQPARAGGPPLDRPGGANTEGAVSRVTVQLDADGTRALLQQVPAAYRTQINDVLLTALALAYRQWSGQALHVDIEGHGREDIFDGLDVSRTVGWFTSVFPALLDLAPGLPAGTALKQVKEQLRRIPRRGIGHGILRYLSPEAAARAALAGAARPGLSFNYLGQFTQASQGGGSWQPVQRSAGRGRHPDAQRRYLIDIDAAIENDQLEAAFSYSQDLHDKAAIERFGDHFIASLRAIIEHCSSADAGGCTPSDFPLARVSQRQLDALAGNGRSLADLYPLAPLQQGMLFQSLYNPGAGVYVEQICWQVRGELDAADFQQAWQRVVDQHPILRTSFHWQQLDAPLQAVRQQAPLPFERHDWQAAAPGDWPARLDAFLGADRRRGLDLNVAPLMRVSLIQLAAGAWYLVWSFHHLILDGWSVSMVLNGVMEAYQAISRNTAPQAERGRPYRDYIEWIARQDQEETARFWREQLRGVTAPTPLSFEQPTPAAGAAAYAEQEIRLAPEILAPIRAMAQQRRLTLNTLIQGAWSMLLGHYGGRSDVVFGSVVSGRPPSLAGVEKMIGLFINTLPVRITLRAEQPLAEWLGGVQQQQADLRQYEYTPLVQVQGWSEVPRGTPLFENLLAFENYPLEERRSEAESALEFIYQRFESNLDYPLGLIAVPGNDLRLRLWHDARRFPAERIALVLADLAALLERFAAAPEQTIGDCLRALPSAGRLGALATERPAPADALAPGEQARIEGWELIRTPYPAGASVHGLFAEQALRAPDAIAVSGPGGSLSYAELDRRANRLARLLQARGVGAETCVGLALERSSAAIVAVLAVLKAGGAYVPFETAHPPARLSALAADAGVKLVIAEPVHAAAFAGLPCPTEELAALEAQAATLPDSAPAAPGSPDQLAYIMYTSGSTGAPKGVSVSHRSIVRLVRDTTYLAVGPADRVMHLAPDAFDASTLEIWAPLLNGARLEVYPSGPLDLDELAAALRDREISVLWLTAGLFHQMVEVRLEALAGVGTVLAGGDVLSPPHVRRLLEAPGRRAVVDGYGPTENTTFTCCYVMRSAAEASDPVPIGSPIANTGVRILDTSLRRVPVGAAGDLYAVGAGLARGYWGRPDLTAEAFVPDPFGPPGSRMYRTGDLARYRADGAIEFLGRSDQQIKIRGFRIEPGEIEAVLRTHPAVRDCLVAVRAVPDKRLYAYLILDPAAPDPGAELRRLAQERLPDYMRPAGFVALERFPLTPNGKVDRRALPDPATAGDRAERAFAAPRTDDEEMLAEIWAGVLGCERVGREDNFFNLGGHSLSSIQVIARIRDLFQVAMPFKTLFEAPTIAGLAAAIVSLRRDAHNLSLPPLRPSGLSREQPLPLSFGQQRLWFIDQLTGSASYNMTLIQQLTGDLNARALEQSLNALVERHEILRTRFILHDGQPAQLIAPAPALGLPIEDLAGLPAAERQAELDRLAASETQQPFDLAAGPLLRARLLRLQPDEHVLILNMHHIISDGWSLGVLMSELAELYAGFNAAGGRAPDPAAALPALPIQYADYAAWQRQWLQGDALEQQLAYWREALSGMPAALDLPTSRPRPPVQSLRGAQHAVRLPGELLGELQTFSQQEGVTLFMTLLAAFKLLLARYSGQHDIVVGTPVAGRTHAELEPLIGFFANTLVLRTRLDPRGTVRETLERVRETTVGALAHQDVPFEQVVDLLQPERDTSRNPLFQVALLFNQAGASPELPGLRARALRSERTSAKVDLTVEITQFADGLGLTLEYATDLFDAAAIARLAGNYQRLLAAMIADPAQRAATLPLLTAGELAEQRRWNDTSASAPPARLPELVAEQARRAPHALAVAQGERALSYGELDGQANRLAADLRERGVGPGSLVGLCAERSPALVVGLLAIMKAGGAYVPLDPAYPADRLAFMVADAGIALLLSETALRGLVPGELEVIALDGWGRPGAPTAAEPPASGATPDHLAYVIYTSGSTGRPKGVTVPHRGLRNLAQAQAGAFGVTGQSRILQFASLNFDASIFEITMAMAAGATLCLAPAGQALLGDDLAVWLREQAISLVTLPPSVLATLPESELPDLKVITVAGEACSADLVARWAPGRRFFNLYGPTEATVWTTAEECLPTGAMPAIGRPIANTEVYLLDAALQLVPAGVPGELHIGGIGLADGYLNRPDLTAERFIPHPWGRPGSRLYKSGDLARHREDGSLEYLGRIDTQVKVRGFRIEPGEIEALLLTHAGVAETLVMARADQGGGSRLVAYVVGAPGATPAAGELRDLLKGRLPEYMVPNAFVTLEAMPLTPNGKIDRRRLPAPDHLRADLAEEFAPPAGAVEETIAAAWRQVLGLERIGVHENFFDLGGHSLLMVQAHKALGERLPRAISLIEMFRRPTISTLAAYFTQDDGQQAAFDQSYQPEERARRQLEARQRRSQARKDKGTA